MNGEFDGAIGQGLLRARVALFPGLDLGFFHRITLKEPLQLGLFAPEAANIRRAK